MIKGFIWITTSVDSIIMLLVKDDNKVTKMVSAAIEEQKEIEGINIECQWKYHPLKNAITKSRFYELLASWGYTDFVKEFCKEAVTR